MILVTLDAQVGLRVKAGRVRLYPGQPALFAREEQSIGRDLDRRMTKVANVARVRVRKRTGTLLTTIRKNPGSTARGQYVDVIAGSRTARYAGVEDQGSGPHVIRARRRRYLRFVVDGQVFFRKSVNHPGTTGSFFLTRSLIFAAT